MNQNLLRAVEERHLKEGLPNFGPGDTLTKISLQYYGTANRWEEIVRANPDIIRDENSIPLGATLRIP